MKPLNKNTTFLSSLLEAMIYLGYGLFLFSCESSKKENNAYNPFPQYNDQFTMVETDVKAFPLDSVTATGESNFQYFEEHDGKKYFCYFNRNDNTILFYDYEQSKLDFKLPLKKRGPDGVGTITGFLVHNLDSIYVYRYGGAFLYLVNLEGTVLKRYDLKSTDPLSLYPPIVGSDMPMTKVGNSMYFNAWGAKNEYSKNKSYPENLVIRLDLLNDSLSYDFRYPDLYREGIWGMQLYVMYNTYNPNTSEFIYSFPIDHYIHITDHHTKPIQKYAGSIFIKRVNSLSNKDRISPPPPEQEWKKEATQGTYRAIKYDQYNDMYYRIAYKGISEEDYNSKHPIKGIFQKISIIILNNKFVKVGEVELDDYKFWPERIFLTKEGINIMQMDFKNEDSLKISVMKLIEK